MNIGINWITPGKKNANNKDYQFRQLNNRAEELISQSFSDQKREYVHNNPVVSGIVEKREDYLFSGAKDYYFKTKWLLEVEII